MFARANRLLAPRLPWWAQLAIGLAAIGLGVTLTIKPLWSLSALAFLVAAGLVLTGVGEIAGATGSARPALVRIVGAVWIGAGALVVAWPGITIWVLAASTGLALVAGGLLKLATVTGGARARARAADQRFVTGLSGLTNALVGILALTWPAATVLVIAVVFGLRTTIFGGTQVVAALRLGRGAEQIARSPARWRRSLRAVGAGLAFVLALGGMAVSVAVNRAQPGEPPAFYRPPSPLPPGELGSVIRSEIVDGYVDGATTYRVLYRSTGPDDEPTAVSALVLVPDGPAPEGGRKVLAYTHGTVGTASRCAPSLAGPPSNPLFLEGGRQFLDAGYVIAATDYEGLGTPGPHAYLVGPVEARNALDSVRAARDLPAAEASGEFAVWGHSQGGHASLFTGELAATYAPELRLVGVAAGAPVPDLIELFRFNLDTTVGKVLIAMALDSWAKVYDTATLAQIVRPAARPIVGRIARNCLYGDGQLLGSVPGALVLDLVFLSQPVWEAEPWRTIAADNQPGQSRTGAPMLVVQGGADTIVDPAVTERFVDRLCTRGEEVDFLQLAGVGHVATGHDAAPAVFDWIEARFAGEPAPSSCS